MIIFEDGFDDSTAVSTAEAGYTPSRVSGGALTIRGPYGDLVTIGGKARSSTGTTPTKRYDFIAELESDCEVDFEHFTSENDTFEDALWHHYNWHDQGRYSLAAICSGGNRIFSLRIQRGAGNPTPATNVVLGATPAVDLVDGGGPTAIYHLKISVRKPSSTIIVSGYVTRSNGDYLTSGGTWSSTPQAFASGNDDGSSTSGIIMKPGGCGFNNYEFTGTGRNFYYDNLKVTNVRTPVPTLPPSGLLLDTGSTPLFFTDTGGTTPVTTDGDLIACFKDQSGNNRHFIQSTSTDRPVYVPDAIRGNKASFPVRMTEGAIGDIVRFMSATVAIDFQNYTILMVQDSPVTSVQSNVVTLSPDGTLKGSLGIGATGPSVHDGSSFPFTDPYMDYSTIRHVPKSSKALVGIISNSSYSLVRLDGTANFMPALTSGTATTLNIGATSDGTSIVGHGNVYRIMVWDHALTSTEYNDVLATVMADHNFSDLWASDSQVVFCLGDSITYTYYAVEMKGWHHQLTSQLPDDVISFSNGQPGIGIAGIVNSAASWTDPSKVCIGIIFGGMNDQPGGNATTMYNALKAQCVTIRNAGALAAVMTLFSNSQANNSDVRPAYNTLIRAGLGVDYDILIDIDLLTIPTVDGIHPSTVGHQMMADAAFAEISSFFTQDQDTNTLPISFAILSNPVRNGGSVVYIPGLTHFNNSDNNSINIGNYYDGSSLDTRFDDTQYYDAG